MSSLLSFFSNGFLDLLVVRGEFCREIFDNGNLIVNNMVSYVNDKVIRSRGVGLTAGVGGSLRSLTWPSSAPLA